MVEKQTKVKRGCVKRVGKALPNVPWKCFGDVLLSGPAQRSPKADVWGVGIFFLPLCHSQKHGSLESPPGSLPYPFYCFGFSSIKTKDQNFKILKKNNGFYI